MPSGEMRRNTRVFCARVLRSGRRLWTGPPEEAKYMRAVNDGEDWIELFEDSDDDVQGLCKENGRHDDAALNQQIEDEMEIDEKRQPEEKSQEMGKVDNVIREDRRWGAVYMRKRKRRDSERLDSEVSNSVDRRYGKKFFRKQAKKKTRMEPMPKNVSGDSFSTWGLAAFVESSCSSRSSFSCLLNLILRYMRRSRVTLPMLSAFLFSEPICSVYSSHGIHFLQESTCCKNSGFFKVMASRDSIPFFAVDFSALPVNFMYLHSSLLLRSALILHVLVIHAMNMELGTDGIIDEEEQPSCITCEIDQSLSRTDDADNGNSVKRKSQTMSAFKLGGRPMQLRSGVITRSMQKRSPVRSKRLRNSSGFGMRKANGALVIASISKQDSVPLFPVKPKADTLHLLRRSSTTNLKELQSSSVPLTRDVDSASCNANILVIESDKCYREEGAAITLEFSESQQWFLVVKKNGIQRFMFSAQKFMRPCCVNRVTRAIIWAGDTGWKLEFPIRQDWNVFKELYKNCSERSVRILPPAPVIPVPGVREVSGYADAETVPFRLPDSYITMQGDEVGRALEKKTPIYDMDSDDDEWLNRFNNESCSKNVPGDSISEYTFELLIDTLERGIFCGPEGYTEVEAVIDRCQGLAAREVLEAVHSYWLSKRRKRSKALVRMFEMYERRRAEVLPKAIFRKKRSFKRQPSQVGRGKQLSFLKAMANEREVVEEQNAVLKVKEANDAARRSEGMAVLKRQRAQRLMEAADLATYKATMALRIAEAAAWAAKSLNASGMALFFPSE